MNKKSAKAKLTEGDRRILSANNNLCTDTHGEGCSKQNEKKKEK
jgi:hypothetical protein